MKKALSLVLSLTMAASLAAPAFAAEEIYTPGRIEEAGAYDSATPPWLDPVLATNLNNDTYGIGANGELNPYGDYAGLTIFPGLANNAAVGEDLYYVVQPGDTETTIALNFYGTYKVASALKAANAGHYAANGKGILEAQRAYRIPAVLKGYTRLDAPVAVDGQLLYKVQPGDTLASIAYRYYNGRSDFAKNIYWQNENRIENYNIIYPGQWLVLPVIHITY